MRLRCATAPPLALALALSAFNQSVAQGADPVSEARRAERALEAAERVAATAEARAAARVAETAAHGALLSRLGRSVVAQERRLAKARADLDDRRREAAAAQVRLAATREELLRFAAAAHRAGREPLPALLAHPDRPLDAARAAAVGRRLAVLLAERQARARRAAATLSERLAATEQAEIAVRRELAGVMRQAERLAQAQTRAQAAAERASVDAEAARARARLLARTATDLRMLADALTAAAPPDVPEKPVDAERSGSPQGVEPSVAPAEQEDQARPSPAQPSVAAPPLSEEGRVERPIDAGRDVRPVEPEGEEEMAAMESAPTMDAPLLEAPILDAPGAVPVPSLSPRTPAPNPGEATAALEIPDIPFAEAKGQLLQPAAGTLRRSRDQDFPGVTWTTSAYAHVIAPWGGTVVFAGPLAAGAGGVVMIEPQNGYGILLSGLGSLDVAVGQRLSAGEPLGRMGRGGGGAAGDLLQEQGGAADRQLLYMEIVRGRTQLDPVRWMRQDDDGSL